ncbi:MAG TPA: MarR family transcriptional regulator [Vicinamibacteria bacterium]|nr:MarR family transcriptional regulator [Vicinamibacteria bacterium]
MNESFEMLSAELRCALRAVETKLEAALEPLGLSLAKFGVLSRLAAAGEPIPLGTLAEQSACVRSNITQLVDRLEADRLVVRAPDPHDRRSIRAELTEAGRERHASAASILRDAEATVFSGLPGHQRELFVQMLRALQAGR